MNKTKTIKKGFGNAFRERRDAVGISRAELAKRMRISPKTIQSWEMGRTFPEQLGLFPLIERELGVSITDLIRVATGEPVNDSLRDLGPYPVDRDKAEVVSVPFVTVPKLIKRHDRLTDKDHEGYVNIPSDWIPPAGVLVATRMNDSGLGASAPLGATLIVDLNPPEKFSTLLEKFVAVIRDGKLRFRLLVQKDEYEYRLASLSGRGSFDLGKDVEVIGHVVGILYPCRHRRGLEVTA